MIRFPYLKIIILLSMVILLQVTISFNAYGQFKDSKEIEEYLAKNEISISLSDPHEGNIYSGKSQIMKSWGEAASVMLTAPPNVQSIDLTIIIKAQEGERVPPGQGMYSIPFDLLTCDVENIYGKESRQEYCYNFFANNMPLSLYKNEWEWPANINSAKIVYAYRILGKPPYYFVVQDMRNDVSDRFEVEVRVNGVEFTDSEPCGGSSFSDAKPLPNRYCGTSKYANDQERYFKFDVNGETYYLKIKISKREKNTFFKLLKISDGDTNTIFIVGPDNEVKIIDIYDKNKKSVDQVGTTNSSRDAVFKETNQWFFGGMNYPRGWVAFKSPKGAGIPSIPGKELPAESEKERESSRATQIPDELIIGGVTASLAIAGGYYVWRHQRHPTRRKKPIVVGSQQSQLLQHKKPIVISEQRKVSPVEREESSEQEDNRGVIINNLSPADKFADYYDPCERLEISVNASNNNKQQIINATISLKIDERTFDTQYITFTPGETTTIPMRITLPNKKGTYRITANAEGLHTNSISDGFQIKVGSPLVINEINFKNESEDKTYEPGSSQDIKVVANNKCINTINATLKAAVKEIYSGAESGLQEIGPDSFHSGISEHSIWIEMPKEEGEYQIKATLVSEEGEILYEHTSSKFNVVQSKGRIIDIQPSAISPCGNSELEIRVQNDREWKTTFKLKLVSDRLNIERKENVFDIDPSSDYRSRFEISPKVVEPDTKSVIKAEAILLSKSGNELHKRTFDLTVESPEVYAKIKVNPSGINLPFGVVLDSHENKTISRGNTFKIEVFVENRSGKVIGLCSNFKLVLPQGMKTTDLEYNGAISAAKDSLQQKFGSKIKESYLSADSLLEYNSAIDSWAKDSSTTVDDILPKFIENFDKPKLDFISSLTQLPQQNAEKMYESTFNRMTSMAQSSIHGLSLGNYSFFDVLKPGGNAKFGFTVDVSTINIKPEIKISPILFHLPYVVLSKEDDVAAAIGSAGIFNGNMGNALQIYADVGKILEKPKELAFIGLKEASQAAQDRIMDTNYIDSWLKRYGGNEREFFQKSYGKPCVVTAQDIVLIK